MIELLAIGAVPSSEFPSLAVNSLALGAVYVPISLAWTIVFKSTRVLNFATGQFLLLGTYLYYALASQMHLPLYAALLGSLALSAIFGAACYTLFIRPLTGLELFGPVILTLGLAIVITNVAAIIWGPANLLLPKIFTDHTYHLGSGIVIDTIKIAAFVVALVAIVVLLVLLTYTRVGVQMKAAAEQPLLASQSGIRISVLFAVGWAIASLLGTIAGITYGYSNILGPPLADAVGNLGVAPAIIGGLDSVPGAILGGLLVAFLETFGTAYLGASAASAVVWLILLLALIVRPRGILGTPLVERV